MAAEKNFENKIKRYLDSLECWHVKFFANAYTKSGIPDLLACINGYFVAIEVKAENGSPSVLQKYNVERLNRENGFAVVVRPSQWDDLKLMIMSLKYNAEEQARELCTKINTPWGI